MNRLFNKRLAAGAAGVALAVLLPFSAFAAGPSIVRGYNDSGNYNYQNQYQNQSNGYGLWNSWYGHDNGNGSNGSSTASTTPAQPPVISGISSPVVLDVGQMGTWSVSASDPQSRNLTYSVNWGDTGGIHSLLAAVEQVFTQTTFTHSYSSAGVYTVTFTVRNGAGLTTTSSVTVNVITAKSGPVISDVNATSTAPHQATLTWNTNENSDSEVWYSTSSPMSASGTPQVSHSAKVFDHSVTLTGLTAGTTYYAIVGSKDSRGNLSTSAQTTFTTQGPRDAKSPAITSVTGSSTVAEGTSATWTINAYDPKNEALTYSVNWGDAGIMPLFAAMNQPVYLQSSTFSHTYANPGTYTITFTAEDTSGLSTSATTSVTVTSTGTTTGSTTIPVISGVNASVTGSSTATVAWTTDQDSDSTVYYSTSEPVIGASSTQSTYSSSTVMSHSVNLTGLTPSTTYYFAVGSSDSAGMATSSALSFMTLANTGTGTTTSTSTGTGSTTSGTPTITLNGSSTVNLSVGDTFTDPGATAVSGDPQNGYLSGIQQNVWSVNTSVPGTTNIVYTVYQCSSNGCSASSATLTGSASTTRTVIVSGTGTTTASTTSS